MFRLFRRSLLCLVVGVTAFGAAGWGFRPRASWTVPLPSSDDFAFGDELRDAEDHEPIWLVIRLQNDDDEESQHQLLAFDAATGATLRSIPLKFGDDPPDLVPLQDGRLAMIAIGPGRLSEHLTSRIFSAQNPDPPREVRFEGEWKIADNGLHVWRLQSKGDGSRLEIRTLEDGGAFSQIAFERGLPGSEDEIIAYSAKTNRIAVSTFLRADGKPPYGIEILDASTGRLLETIAIPIAYDTELGPRDIEFRNGGAELEMYLPGAPTNDVPDAYVVYRIDLATRAFRRLVIRPVITNLLENNASLDVESDKSGRSVITRKRMDPSGADVFFQEDPNLEPAWRAIPFAVVLKPYHPHSPGHGLVGVRSFVVPQRRQIIVQSEEESLGAVVPEALRSRFPATWTKQVQTRIRWHDWDADEWRDVGCPHGVQELSVRPNSLLTVSVSKDGSHLLQSWPLPPRDPKWPALGVAAFCTAATWLGVCEALPATN